MKPITDYVISDGTVYSYNSKLCGLACSIEHPHTTELSFYINELCFSYFNQWQLIVDAYQELEHLHSTLNKLNDQPTDNQVFSEYDLYSTQIEGQCRDYAHLMIISIKSLLDLFACLVDVIVNQTIREEYQMVDLRSICKKLENGTSETVLTLMQNLLNKELNPWIDIVKLGRDRLIHRGYRIKASFEFSKTDELFVKMIKGNSEDEAIIGISQLFDDFIIGLQEMESVVGNALLTSVPELSDGQIVEMSYRAGGGVTEYFIKEV